MNQFGSVYLMKCYFTCLDFYTLCLLMEKYDDSVDYSGAAAVEDVALCCQI